MTMPIVIKQFKNIKYKVILFKDNKKYFIQTTIGNKKPIVTSKVSKYNTANEMFSLIMKTVDVIL